MDLNSSQTDSD